MSERQDTLQQYLSDMLAVERHILPAIDRKARKSVLLSTRMFSGS